MPGGVGGGGTTPGESGGGGGGEAPACSHRRGWCDLLACAAEISASTEAQWAVARGNETARGHDHTSDDWLASVIAVLAQKNNKLICMIVLKDSTALCKYCDDNAGLANFCE